MSHPANHDGDHAMADDAGVNAMTADELRLLIERAERLEEEKKGIGEDIKDVFGEAKARGFDVKTMKKIMRIRKMPKDAFAEEEAVLETYMAALGMI